ncbi:TIGR03086 family metal-binding protein [Nonomuraea sp. NPDC050663]|uniref:TIGR03086 family metal-binding protein n=1 Tax=Nonomuraea sp. NPDC050663 TaxID=3364370 RepID=UPI00378FF546
MHLMNRAAQPMIQIIRALRPEDLAKPTPCAEFDVRELINHMLYWGPSLVAAAYKRAPELPAVPEDEADLAAGDWAAALESQTVRLAEAWSRPEAWEGTASLGGPTELPASLIGGMAAGELVIHGWDLARATGQEPEWDGELIEFVHDEVAKTALQGREMGVYGPEVEVPEPASLLEKALGLTGRDPR